MMKNDEFLPTLVDKAITDEGDELLGILEGSSDDSIDEVGVKVFCTDDGIELLGYVVEGAEELRIIVCVTETTLLDIDSKVLKVELLRALREDTSDSGFDSVSFNNCVNDVFWVSVK